MNDVAALGGTWKFTADTPMGAQAFTMDVLPQGNKFTAKVKGDFGELDVVDGTIDEGPTLRCGIRIKRPLPVKLKCTFAFDDGRLTGVAKVTGMGSFSMTGVRP